MHIYKAYIYHPQCDNRCMEYCYTKYVSHIAECTYTEDTCTTHTPIDNRSMEYHYTK